MFLVENYDDPGDEIFLFGFSRGAYTALRGAGFIRNCGLLRRGVRRLPAMPIWPRGSERRAGSPPPRWTAARRAGSVITR